MHEIDIVYILKTLLMKIKGNVFTKKKELQRWHSGLQRCPASGGLSFRILARQAYVVKTGSDSSTAKRWVIDVSVLGDEHYIRMTLVTVGVASYRTLTAQRPCVPSTGQNLQPFTDNSDVSK